MKKRKKQKYYPTLTVILLMLVAGIVTAVVTNIIHNWEPKPKEPTTQELYDAAVADAMFIEEGEQLPLKSLADAGTASTNSLGQVLLITWHDTPYFFRADQSSILNFGTVWTVADGEILTWYANNAADIEDEDMVLRMEQLMGLPPKTGNTHFSAMWVWKEDIKRPAYTTSIEAASSDAAFLYVPEESYKEWFDKTIIAAYYDGTYPWTRLGYTYDWALGGTEYGLSQFIISDNSEVSVNFTYTNSEFFEWLRTNAPAPTASPSPESQF